MTTFDDAGDDGANEGPMSAIQKKLMAGVSKFAQEGFATFDSPAVWAETKVRANNGDTEKAIDQLVRESIFMSSTTGAITSIGGFATMWVGLPVNIAGVLVINVRLTAAIAHLRGFNVNDPFMHHFIAVVASGSSIQSMLSEIGIKVGQKISEQMLKKLSIKSIRAINRRAGFLLVTKYGTKRGIVTLSKAIPLIGAVVGGTIDGVGTSVVGKAARKSFVSQS